MDKIYGINPIKSGLDSNRVKKLFISKGFNNSTILDLAKKKKVPIDVVEKEELSRLSGGKNNQGCVASIIPLRTYTLDEVIKSNDNQNRIVAILDELSDPNNLGAIIRSADIFGVEAIIYKKRNNVSLSPLVAKISSGAIDYVKCCEVTNLSTSINTLKKAGFWVYGLAGEATREITSLDKNGRIAIVIGSEGSGISRLVRENCDDLVKIKQYGHTPCLNASNAAAICFYELKR